MKRLEAATAINPLALDVLHNGYMNSIWLRGDNTIESAKKPEYGSALDARELYPHLKVTTVEEAARELYRPLS